MCRVFTTIQEVGLDLSLLAGFLLNALLTGIQLAQVMSLIANAMWVDSVLICHVPPRLCTTATWWRVTRRRLRRNNLSWESKFADLKVICAILPHRLVAEKGERNGWLRNNSLLIRKQSFHPLNLGYRNLAHYLNCRHEMNADRRKWQSWNIMYLNMMYRYGTAERFFLYWFHASYSAQGDCISLSNGKIWNLR